MYYKIIYGIYMCVQVISLITICCIAIKYSEVCLLNQSIHIVVLAANDKASLT